MEFKMWVKIFANNKDVSVHDRHTESGGSHKFQFLKLSVSFFFFRYDSAFVKAACESHRLNMHLLKYSK